MDQKRKPAKRPLQAVTQQAPEVTDTAFSRVVETTSDPDEVRRLTKNKVEGKVALTQVASLRMYPKEKREIAYNTDLVSRSQRGSYSQNDYIADAVRWMNQYVTTHGQLPPDIPMPDKRQ